MDRSDSIDRALSSLKKIEALHQQFVTQFSNSTTTRAGSIASVNGELQVACFGNNVACKARPILQDESVAYEYHFSVRPDAGDEISLVSAYLTQDGHINAPLVQGSRICDFNNQYIAERVVDLVANAMLRSAFFAPRA